MSKTISVPLKAHFAQGTTTRAQCWKATRRDGFVLAVTTWARDLLFEDVLYVSRYGFTPKAISGEASGAVQNTEVDSFLSSQITEEDIKVGLWDGCVVQTFEVNARDLSMGKMSLGTKTMGELSAGELAFRSELRGLTQSLQKVVARFVTKGCGYTFGDPATCRKDLAPLAVSGTFTNVIDRRTLVDTSRSEPNDYFGAGVLTIDSGAAAGQSLEIYSYDSTTKIFVTHLPFEFNVATGDAYTVTPGCRKRYTEDCRTKWANTNNFGGFDKVPGSDKVLGLGGAEGTNL